MFNEMNCDFYDTSYKDKDKNGFIQESQLNNLKERVSAHKHTFQKLFFNRYMELLPTVINYNLDGTNIDKYLLEISLRNNYHVCVGECTDGKIRVIGYTQQKYAYYDNMLNYYNLLTEDDIIFIIPERLRLKKYTQITELSKDSDIANFVVFTNKVLNYNDDRTLIQYYINELAEVVLSRFSLIMQTKIVTIFKDEIGSIDISKIVNDLYNGSPFISVSKLFDADEDLVKFDNSSIAQNLIELKREYQNKLSELNNLLGIQSLAVEKNSGVSDTEAKGNKALTVTNSNIYIEARKRALNLLNDRYKLNLDCFINDDLNTSLVFNNEVTLNDNDSDII